jgi:hypothetical protein
MSVTIKPLGNPIGLTPPSTLLTDLVEVWEPTNGTILYGSNSVVDGTIIDAIYGAGLLDFNNINDRVEMDSIPELWDGINDKMSVSIWFNIVSTAANNMLVTKFSSFTGEKCYLLYVSVVAATGNLRLWLGRGNTSNSQYRYWTTSVAITTGSLHHLVITLDVATLTPIFYYNNTVVSTSLGSLGGAFSTLEVEANPTDFKIAGYRGSSGTRIGIDGEVGQVGLWKKVLSPAEVTDLNNSGTQLDFVDW